MKKIILLFIVAFFLTVIAFGQTNGINYKAIIKDASGNVVANQAITVQFSILKGTAQTNVYTETHNPTTNTDGLVILDIGTGTVVSGTFAVIDWGSDTHSLNVQVDITGGTTFTDLGTTQFMAVPYAIHSLTSSSLNNQVNLLDIGIISAFPGTTYPNNSYLPLSGGTYNNTDFPDFAAFIPNLSSEVVADNGDGTFTLANWNSNGIFLRGQGGQANTLGLVQNNATRMPNNTFTANPPSTNTNTTGNHNHTIRTRQDDWNVSGGPPGGRPSYGTDNGVLQITNNTDNAGNHAHIVDIPQFNIFGGDLETRPINRSITWVIKVKPSVAFINNSSMKMAISNSKYNNTNKSLNDFKINQQVDLMSGDVFIKDINRGVIMKSPSGKCFRYQPNEKGLLEGKKIVCPNN